MGEEWYTRGKFTTQVEGSWEKVVENHREDNKQIIKKPNKKVNKKPKGILVD